MGGPREGVGVEHVERGLIAGEGGVDEAEAAVLGVGVGVLGVGWDFVARLHALEPPILQLPEARLAQQVLPFLYFGFFFFFNPFLPHYFHTLLFTVDDNKQRLGQLLLLGMVMVPKSRVALLAPLLTQYTL